MKRDMDYVREILLRIEEAEKPPSSSDFVPEDATDEQEGRTVDHFLMLVEEAKLLSGIPWQDMQSRGWVKVRLTWKGHEFLDAIRDPEIWAKTKAGAEKVGGFGLDVMKALAIGLIKKKAKDLTDVDLDL